MSKITDRLASALGFNTQQDLDEEYDDFDDYYEDDDFDSTPQDSIRGYSAPRNDYRNDYDDGYSSNRNTGFLRSSGTTRVNSTRSSYRGTDRGGKVVNLNANVQMEVVVASPDTLDAAQEIAYHIKEKKPVIINLEFVEHSTAQRITDFLCGCCCAMNGNIQRIADKIFMIAPDNVDFAGDVALQESLRSQGELGFLYGDENR